MEPDPEADDFQNLIFSSLSTDTPVIKKIHRDLFSSLYVNLLTDIDKQRDRQTDKQTNRQKKDKHADKRQIYIGLYNLIGRDNKTNNYKLINNILFLVLYRRTSVYWSTPRRLVLLSNSHKQV